MAATNRVPKECTVTDLIIILQLTQQRVSQLEKAQILRRLPNGKFDTYEAVRAFYEYKFCSSDELDYLEEKAKHEAAKRQLAELELAKRQDEVHEAADVEMVMTDMLTNIRSQLLALPAKMAPLLANRDKGYIAQELTVEIESRLTELSDYTPQMFDGGQANAAEDD